MTEKLVEIRLENGLEARPVAVLVQKASMFDSRVYLRAGGKRVNAKSIMGMMSLGLDAGSEVTVETDGEDENEAAECLEKYLTGQES